MSEVKFKNKNQKLQMKEHNPDSEFVDCPVKNEEDNKIDEHPIRGLAVYES